MSRPSRKRRYDEMMEKWEQFLRTEANQPTTQPTTQQISQQIPQQIPQNPLQSLERPLSQAQPQQAQSQQQQRYANLGTASSYRAPPPRPYGVPPEAQCDFEDDSWVADPDVFARYEALLQYEGLSAPEYVQILPPPSTEAQPRPQSSNPPPDLPPATASGARPSAVPQQTAPDLAPPANPQASPYNLNNFDNPANLTPHQVPIWVWQKYPDAADPMLALRDEDGLTFYRIHLAYLNMYEGEVVTPAMLDALRGVGLRPKR